MTRTLQGEKQKRITDENFSRIWTQSGKKKITIKFSDT